MAFSIKPGEDAQDIILYMRESEHHEEPHYGLDLLMLLRREDHYYVYSEYGWINGASISDIQEDYLELSDDYLVTHTISEFEAWLKEHYDIRFPYSLVYNNQLTLLLIGLEDNVTLQRMQVIYRQLADDEERALARYQANSAYVKRAIHFYRWQYMILLELNQVREDNDDIKRIAELLQGLPDEEMDAFCAESYEMLGDHYDEHQAYKKAAVCFYQAWNILKDDPQHLLGTIIVASKQGDALRQLGQDQQAYEMYQYALTHLAPIVHDDESLMIQMASLNQNMGRVLETLERRSEAGISYLNELKTLDRIVTLYPAKENAHNYIIGLHNMASFYAKEDITSALSYYHRCLNAAYGYEKQYAHVETSSLLAELYREIGMIYLSFNDLEKMERGIDYLLKTIEINKNRFAQSHLPAQGLTYGVSVGELAKAYQQMADERMYETYRVEMTIFDDLYAHAPNHLNYRNHLKVHRLFAQVLIAADRPEEVTTVFEMLEKDLAEARKKAAIDQTYQEDLTQSLYFLGSLYLSDADQKQGLTYLEEAYKLTDDVNLLNLCGEAIARYELENGQDVAKAYALYCEIIDRSQNLSAYDQGHAYENMAYYYYVTNDLARSLSYHQKELTIFRKLYEATDDDNDYQNYLIALKQTGDVAIALGNEESLHYAIRILKEQYVRLKAAYDAHRLERSTLAAVLEKLGRTSYRLGADYYEQARAYYDQAYIYLDDQENLRLARLEGKRGNLAELTHRFDEAFVHYRHQYAIAEKLNVQQPDDDNAQELIVALHNIAMVQMARHHYQEAIDTLQQELQHRVVRYQQGDLKQRKKIGLCHRYLGESLQALKKQHAALIQYKIFHYYADDPQSEAIALEKMGNIYAKTRHREELLKARDCYLEVYHYIEKMHNETSLAVIIQKLAYVCFTLGEDYYDEAMALYRKQGDILEKMCERDQKYEADYAICLNNQAVILKATNQEAALRLFTKSVTLLARQKLTPLRLLRLGNTYRMMGDLTGEPSYYQQAIDYLEKAQIDQAAPYLAACQQAIARLKN